MFKKLLILLIVILILAAVVILGILGAILPWFVTRSDQSTPMVVETESNPSSYVHLAFHSGTTGMPADPISFPNPSQ